LKTQERALMISTLYSSINTFFDDIATDPDYDADKISSYRIGSDDLTYTDLAYDAIHDYQIEPLLRHLKNTAPGLDNLPSWLFRACSYELAGVIADLLNLSFSSGRVPVSWLSAIVTPVPKVPQPQQLSDFRPISVTPIISRVAEKLIVTRWLCPAILGKILHSDPQAVLQLLLFISCIM